MVRVDLESIWTVSPADSVELFHIGKKYSVRIESGNDSGVSSFGE